MDLETKNLLAGINELANTSVKKEKTEILKKYRSNYFFEEVMGFLYNPFKIVGISTKKINKDVVLQEHNYNIVELINYLLTNNTGNDISIGHVKYFLQQFNDVDRLIFEQIITKTISLGVSAKSVNAAYGSTFVPTFDVQLAFPYDKTITSTSTTRQIDRYTDQDLLYLTQKLDGFRGLMVFDNELRTFSRKGQLITGLNQLHSDLQDLIVNNNLQKIYPDGFVLDGELLLDNKDNLASDELFRATTKVLRKDGDKKDIIYNIFDIVPLDEFYYHDKSSETYEARRMKLETIEDSQFVKVVPVLDIVTKDKIPYWSNYATEHGWEGVMLNYAKGYYRTKRSPELLKVKKMHTADLPIVGFNQAIDGKYVGKLQSINVQLDDENIVQVGSGLTEELREEIWNNQEKYLGVMVEIQYFEMTENQNGGKSLRFPVFKDFRFDKTPEDINVE